MEKKRLNGCLTVSLTFIVPFILVVAVGGLAFINATATGPANVEITIQHSPSPAVVGQQLILLVQISNQADEPQLLDSVDIAESFLEGFKIQRAVPPYRTTQELFDFYTFDLQHEIAAGDTLEVQFFADPTAPGEYPGWIDVCVNLPGNCARFEGVITVIE